MSWGFTAYTPAGHLQIGSGFKNLRLVQSGSASTSSGAVPFSFDITGGAGFVREPFVMIRPPLNTWAGGRRRVFLDDGGWGFAVYRGYEDGSYLPHFTYSYKVFWPDPLLPVSGSHGLIVRDGSGSTVFDSREEYFDWMHFQDVWVGTYLDGTVCAETFEKVITINHDLPDVGGVWFLLTQAMQGVDDSTIGWMGRRTSNTQVQYKHTTLGQPGWGFPSWHTCEQGVLVFGSAVL